MFGTFFWQRCFAPVDIFVSLRQHTAMNQVVVDSNANRWKRIHFVGLQNSFQKLNLIMHVNNCDPIQTKLCLFRNTNAVCETTSYAANEDLQTLEQTIVCCRPRGSNQRRMNNSSKYSNWYGSRTFGGSAVLCVKLVFYYMLGWLLDYRCPKQILKGAYKSRQGIMDAAFRGNAAVTLFKFGDEAKENREIE